MAKVIWLTGLSGVGKTTLSKRIYKILKKKKCLIIDGDIFRKRDKQFSFTKKNIAKNNLRIISYCKKKLNKYDFIIVSVISPLKKTRSFANKIFKENYFEIYLFATIKTLIKRDTKGLYNLAKKKIIKNLIGFNSKIYYEKSSHRHLRINTKLLNVNQCTNKILKIIKVKN